MNSNWTKVGGTSLDGFWSAKEPGFTLEGEWLGSQPGKYDNRLGQVRTPDGATHTFTLTAVLASHLARVRAGAQVCIVYGGIGTSRAGRDLHTFDVFVEDAEAVADAAKTTRAVVARAHAVEPLLADDDSVPF